MQKRLLIKIGYVCKIPWVGAGEKVWPAGRQSTCEKTESESDALFHVSVN